MHGLLNLNPLERWSPAQARTHPFITQQKFTGPFVPAASLGLIAGGGSGKEGARSPAPGVQAQMQAEMAWRAKQAQPMYSQQQQPQALPYPQGPAVSGGYGQQQMMPILQAPPPTAASAGGAYGYPSAQQPYPQQQQQGGGGRGQQQYPQQQQNRQRASTLDSSHPSHAHPPPHQGVPAALQRVVSHLDPNAPIRLQPSPAYYPPPPDGGESGQRRRARGQTGEGRNFVRALEERTLEEGWQGGGQGGGGWGV